MDARQQCSVTGCPRPAEWAIDLARLSSEVTITPLTDRSAATFVLCTDDLGRLTEWIGADDRHLVFADAPQPSSVPRAAGT